MGQQRVRVACVAAMALAAAVALVFALFGTSSSSPGPLVAAGDQKRTADAGVASCALSDVKHVDPRMVVDAKGCRVSYAVSPRHNSLADVKLQPPANALRGAYVFTLYGEAARSLFEVLAAAVLTLRETSPVHPVVAMVTPEWDAPAWRRLFNELGVRLVVRPYLLANCRGRWKQPRFRYAYSKLHVLSLTEYDVVVLLDFDLAVIENVDRGFGLLAAAPSDVLAMAVPSGNAVRCDATASARRQHFAYNTGVVFLRPNRDVFDLVLLELGRGGFECNVGDQSFWNGAVLGSVSLGSRTRCLPVTYNCRGEPAQCFSVAGNIRVRHWSGESKPWGGTYDHTRASTPSANDLGAQVFIANYNEAKKMVAAHLTLQS